MTKKILPAILLGAALALSGCATYQESGLDRSSAFDDLKPLPRETEDKILALDPEHITEADIRGPLAQAPAPQVINIHGGIYPVYLCMESFSKFLAGMGYPESRARNADGSWSFSCYDSSETIAGAVAWYYEREGMRPMLVGHSQGGIQAVKVLDQLAGKFSAKIPVWNPAAQKAEDRFEITDPLTGQTRSVVGLQVCYTTVVGAGGLTRALPNQWVMNGKLHYVPDSTEEFTGFAIGFDLLGGDALGLGSANQYRAEGKAVVRNVQLPASYSHVTVPDTHHLAANQQVRDWINNYNTPSDQPEFNEHFDADTSHILWGADVWHSIKKHWVIELQNLIRAKRMQRHDG